jgi:hypothetical protein
MMRICGALRNENKVEWGRGKSLDPWNYKSLIAQRGYTTGRNG